MIHQFFNISDRFIRKTDCLRKFFQIDNDIRDFAIDISSIPLLKNFVFLNNINLNNAIFGIPFEKNTKMKIGNLEGIVEKIRMRHVILRNKKGTIYVPINKLYREIIIIEK